MSVRKGISKELPPPTWLAKAHARALARTYLHAVETNEDPETVEDLRKAVLDIWRARYMYYKDEDVFRELVEKGLLPADPDEGE
jgi:hypothetical protein